MKWEPLFAHLLKLFIDTDRLKKKKKMERISEDADEKENSDKKNLTQNQISS